MGKKRRIDIDFPQAITLIVILAVGVLVICRLLFWNDTVTISIQSSGDRSDFDAVGALSYSERIAQVAELTIATVLTLGGALLALNWYTSHRNFQDERERVEQLERDTKESVDRKIEADAKEFREAISEMRTTLAASENDFNDFTQNTINALRHLSDAIADTLQATYISMTNQRGQAVLVFIGHELIPLVTSLNVLQSLERTESRQTAASRMVNTFLNRYDFVFHWDPKNPLPNRELLLMDEVSRYLSDLRADQPLARWQEFRDRFTLEEEPAKPEESADT